MTSVSRVYQHKYNHKGCIGVEIEMEGDNLPTVVPKWWTVKRDDSLRNGGLEYVFKAPLTLDESKEALKHLKQCMTTNNTKFVDSVRAGVHIHINVLDMELRDVAKFLTLYFVMEDLLLKYCGDSREGNLFCLRATDAPYLVHTLTRAFSAGRFKWLHTDELRYAAMNVKALGDYGSLEFRAIRTTDDFSVIEKWIEILLRIKEESSKFNLPNDIMSQVSEIGAVGFVKKILGEHHEYFSGDVEIHRLIRNGVENIQDFVYTIDWLRFDTEGKNPFKKGVSL